jgi:hypothetical protein
MTAMLERGGSYADSGAAAPYLLDTTAFMCGAVLRPPALAILERSHGSHIV